MCCLKKRIMKTSIRIISLSILFLLFYVAAMAQTGSSRSVYTIEDCYELVYQNHPIVKRYDLMALTEEYTLKNASTGYIPQLTLYGAASYQTEALEFPFQVPGVEMPTYSKDQYAAILQLSQVIWDGGKIAAEKKSIQAKTAVDVAQQDVNIYALREKINDLYFGILYIDGQLDQTELLISELDREYVKLEKCIENGVANLSDLDLLEVEKISHSRNVKNLSSMLETYLRMLSLLTGVKIDDASMLESPFREVADPETLLAELTQAEVLRPELKLFAAQKLEIEAKVGQQTAESLPQLSLFVHGGYGRHGLNIMDNTFRPFAIGGIKLSWNISKLYGAGYGKKIVDYSKGQVDAAQESFLFNTSLQAEEQAAEVRRFISVLEDDRRIVTLRENIRKSTEAAVENGTKNASDLISQINQETAAKQQLLLHEIELMKSLYELKNIKNQ